VRTTAILVRWQRGWSWVDINDPDLRIEISQGHSGDGPEIVRKATAELATYGEGQTEITVGIDPDADDPVPLVDYIEGDELHVDGAWRELAAMASTFNDATGQWTDIPQFGTVLDDPELRIDRTFRNLGGLNGGTSHLARPVATVPQPNVKPST